MTLELAQNWMVLYMLVLTRVAAVLMSAPVFGSYSIPMQIRAYLALAVSAMVTPMQGHIEAPDFPTFSAMVPIMLEELMVGLCLGLGAQLLFIGAQVAGQMAGQMSGMQMADVYNPASGTNSPLFAQLLDLTSLGTFVLLGGPAYLLSSLLATFQRVPPGEAQIPENFVHYYVALLASGFEMGIRMGAPMILALLLSILLLGLIGRTLPQLNILQVGFNINSAVMLVALALALNMGIWLMSDQFESGLDALMQAALGDDPITRSVT